MKNFLFAFLVFISQAGFLFAQTSEDKPLKFNLNEEGTRYFQFSFLNQVWLRYSQANPGSTLFDERRDHLFDISLRRTRVQMFGQITERAFLYFQFGQNNFNFTSPKQIGAFFHDALCEYYILKENLLKVGAGLTIASGLSRFTQPSIGTILTADVPVFAQATTGVIDQFSRRLSVYARGQIGKFDYRLIISDPFRATTGQYFSDATGINNRFSQFASKGHSKMYHGYFFYQFLEKEPHNTYFTGTYLGKRKLFNLGAGFITQDNALWRLTPTNDTAFFDMLLLAADAFIDIPLNTEKGTALSAYLGIFNNNYGPDYIRNLGPNNPYTGTEGFASFNGPGTAYPMMGTGNVVYTQAGYLFPREFFRDAKNGTIQPYGALMHANYKALEDPVIVYDLGINYLLNGHKAKVTLNYQNRPVFFTFTDGSIGSTQRKGMLYLQYQLML